MKALLDSLPLNHADRKLASQLDPARLPAHVAIIMDGNGRWAGRRLLPRVAGHKAGVTAVREVVETSSALGLQALTLYAFSVENWKRPAAEIETLWGLLRYYLRHELETMLSNNVRLQAIGRIEDLPKVVRQELDETIARTASNTGLQLNLAVNYGGRTELVDAVQSLVNEARAKGTLGSLEISEAAINRHLYTAGMPDPDLLIRTSGEMRVSNFLLWQIAYTEIYVTQTYWPDFRRKHLLEAIADYQKRDRRFGGLTVAGAEASVASEPAEVGSAR